ncbi:MAG: HAMP domain-containing protein [Caldilineae bacterium]|nr:HAMP domain-containing protein [Chloroflexota bacterium]MCB9177196.1 HAMP domain-containing protein [Caldilineae bacterium]
MQRLERFRPGRPTAIQLPAEADAPRPAPAAPRLRLHRPALLIRWKLTIFFSVVVALMLSSFSLFFYWYFSGSVMRDIDRSSRDRAKQVVDSLQRAIDTERVVIRGPFLTPAEASLLQRLGSLDAIAGDWLLSGVAVRLYDANGHVVDSNDASLGQRLTAKSRMPIDYGLLQAANAGQPHRVTLVTSDLGAYYSYSQPVFLRQRLWAVVEILSPLAASEASLERLGRLLFLGTLLATAMSVLIGAAISEAALRPIDAITRTARRIQDKRDLSQRVPADGPPDELGRLASTINTMLDQIEGMFDRQRRFLSDVSHELRTPLTTIRGEAELMERTGRMDPEGLAAIRGEAERMTRMVGDLLMLARSDEESALERRPVDLSALMAELGRQAQLLGGEHHRLQVEAEPGLSVIGDRDRLKQLVLNLLGNAMTHTPAGTTVRLALRRTPEGALIEVADDGPGIPAEDQPFLFDRFYRVDKARHRASGGTGLGLAIVQAVARAHDGRVAVVSTAGHGTAFRVTLPLT